MPVSKPTMPLPLSSHQWQGMCLWRPLWSGGLPLILCCTWLLASPPLALREGHAEEGFGGAMMSPEWRHIRHKALLWMPHNRTVLCLPYHSYWPFLGAHPRDPCKGDFILAGMKTDLGVGSSLQKCGYRTSCPTAQGWNTRALDSAHTGSGPSLPLRALWSRLSHLSPSTVSLSIKWSDNKMDLKIWLWDLLRRCVPVRAQSMCRMNMTSHEHYLIAHFLMR